MECDLFMRRLRPGGNDGMACLPEWWERPCGLDPSGYGKAKSGGVLIPSRAHPGRRSASGNNTPQAAPAAHPAPLKGEPLTGCRVKPPLPGEVSAAGRRKGGNFPGDDHAAFCKTPQAAARPWPGCGSRIMLRALVRRLHSATAAPASSRCIRRRRRSTPQPLKGSLSAGSRPRPTASPGTSCIPQRRFDRAPRGNHKTLHKNISPDTTHGLPFPAGRFFVQMPTQARRERATEICPNKTAGRAYRPALRRLFIVETM
mgnify:CR=1 FL=1